MPFSCTAYPYSKDKYLEQVGTVLEDKATLVFLDTNILAYQYKLLDAARSEFFAWTDQLIAEDRLRIPAWVLSEYLAKLKQKKLGDYTARSNEPEEILRKLENLQRMASLFVDDSVLSGISYTGGRNAFMNDFQAAISNLSKFTCVFKHQFDAATIHKEISDHLSNAVLPSRIADLCVRADREGAIRSSHRMPPGFKDGGKDENKYGDLIIWFEILDCAKASVDKFSKVVILTNDVKPDWVYVPDKRVENISGKAKEVPNRDPAINLPDPRLVAEFHSVVGNRDLHLFSLPVCIEALLKARGSGLQNLATAIQVEVETAKENALGDDAEALTASDVVEAIADTTLVTDEAAATVELPEIGATVAYAPDALRDAHYELKEGSDIDSIIRDLKSHNWYVQNPAISRIKGLRNQPLLAEEWFVLGRNIYQAACGSAVKAVEFVRNLDIELARHDREAANHILAGMVFEVYFNGDGTLRQTPKSQEIDGPFREIAKPSFSTAADFIRGSLAPHRDEFLIVPPDTGVVELHVSVILVVDAESGVMNNQLDEITLGGRTLLFDIAAGGELGRSSRWWLNNDQWSLQEIKSSISEYWVLPSWQISIETNLPLADRDKLCVPEGKILRLGNQLRIQNGTQ